MNSFTRSTAVPVLIVLVLAFISFGCGSSGGRRPVAPSGIQVAEPAVDRPAGYFVDPIDVYISPGTDGTFGDTIELTTDGSDPSCGGGTAYASTTVTISADTTIKAVACMDGYDDSDILVATYTVMTPDSRVSPGAGTPIQDAIDAAATGDVIYIEPGTYTENNGQVTINKRVTLIGAGSGDDPATNTILSSNAPGDLNPIHISTGGASATSRVAITSLRVTGSTGPSGNAGGGIEIGTLDGYIEFDNVASVGNSGNGIHLNISGDTQDIIVRNCDLSLNGNQGFRVPSSVGNIDGLSIDNCLFEMNTYAGVLLYDLALNVGDTTNVSIRNSTFKDNGVGKHTSSDMVLTGFGGNAILSTISIISSGSDTGIRISGYGDSGTSSPNKTGLFAAGDITLSNIDVGGFQRANGSYPSGALVITRYLGLGNLSINNVNLSSTAPNGLFLGTIAAGASTASGAGLGPKLGDLVLDGTFTDNIRLGKHGNSGSYLPTDIDIDATGVTFQGALSDAYIEARIHHWNDDPLLGLVSWTTP